MNQLFQEFGTGIGLVILIMGAAIVLLILFYIVRTAVRMGNSDVLREIERTNRMKRHELKIKGVPKETLDDLNS